MVKRLCEYGISEELEAEKSRYHFGRQILILFMLYSIGGQTSNAITREKHFPGYCAMYDICGSRTDGKVLNCPFSVPTVKPDDLLSAKIQSLCPTITGNVCCSEAQFDTLLTQVQQAKVIYMMLPFSSVPFLVGCPACLRNFLHLFCELSCSPNQSLFINVTSTAKVNGNMTVDGIEFYITDSWGEGLYDSCKDVKFGTINSRSLDFVGAGSKNFTDWFTFIGKKVALKVSGSPYGIRFLPNAPESYGMSSLNTSTYPCADTSLGCSCGDCPSTSVCSNTAPPSTHKSGSCTVKIGSLKAKCIDFAMTIMYIILVSTFFGWVLFYKSRKRNQAYRMKAFVNSMDGGEPQSVNRQKDENLQTDMLQGTQTRNRFQLSIVQGYLSNFYRGYGTWVARNPTIVLIVLLAVVLLLCICVIRFKVETWPEKVGV